MPLNKAYLTPKAKEKSSLMAIRKLDVSLIAMLIFTTISACASNSKIIVDRDGLTDVAEITRHLESYIGQSVLVRNNVLKTVGKKGFVLDKDRAFSGDTILVLNISKMPLLFSNESTLEILVRGTVEKLTLTDLEQKYGLKLNGDLYAQYENQPVIIADSLTLSPDPEDLTSNPQAYYNKPLAVKGELEDLKSYGIFELDEEQVFGGEDLIVIQPKPRIELYKEQTAIIYGTLRPLVVIELERDYDLGWDLSIQAEIEAEYAQKPVLVAEKIQLLQ
ncbi:MAG TPA: hypothetical protein V6C71_11585 [Coleofasciculaceae cyanobacterium]|jgi:hypothetical protein